MNSPPLVSIRDLHVSFRARGATMRAVDGVDLDWRRGEVLGVVGESGSGKTTLGRAIMGLQPPTSGEVFVDGAPGASHRRRERARLLQMIFQDPYQSLDPRQPIGAQVMEGLEIHRLGRTRRDRVGLAVKALHDAGLAPADRWWQKFPHELSGGQRQRVVIATALALNSTGLVCDEPVSALDASVRTQVLSLLARLRLELRLSLMLITHDVGMAWAMCDRVAVMYLGRVVEVGRTEEVLLAPRHPYTRALLEAVPSAHPSSAHAGARLAGPAPDPGAIPSGCRFHPRCVLAEERCRQVDPVLAGAPHGAACLVVNDPASSRE
jgi:peptide/nickel transport system ATP-binding protein